MKFINSVPKIQGLAVKKLQLISLVSYFLLYFNKDSNKAHVVLKSDLVQCRKSVGVYYHVQHKDPKVQVLVSQNSLNLATLEWSLTLNL